MRRFLGRPLVLPGRGLALSVGSIFGAMSNAGRARSVAQELWSALDSRGLSGPEAVAALTLLRDGPAHRGTQAARTLARRLLRDGVPYAETTLGPGAAAAACAQLGWWHEVGQLYERHAATADAAFCQLAVSDPALPLPALLERLAAAHARGRWSASASAALARSLRRATRSADALAVLGWSRDRGVSLDADGWGLLMACQADEGHYADVLQAMAECPPRLLPRDAALAALVRRALPAQSVAEGRAWFAALLAPLPELQRNPRLVAALSVGQGARDANEAVRRLEEQVDHWGPAEWAVALPLVLKQCAFDGYLAAGRAVLRWAAPLLQHCDAVDAVGHLALALARESASLSDVEECLAALVAAGQRPGGLVFAAVINVHATHQQWEAARAVLARMHEVRVVPTRTGVRYLMDQLHAAQEYREERDTWLQCLEQRLELDVEAWNRLLRCLFELDPDEGLAYFTRLQDPGVEAWQPQLQPDVVTYTTVLGGLARWGRVEQFVSLAEELLAHPTVRATDACFTTLRSFCRTYGRERLWPRYRDWCVSHGVNGGEVPRPWRAPELDPQSQDASRLLFP